MAKFNYCHDLVRYGVFIEQSAKNNLALGNICNNDLRGINVFNNSATPRPPTQFNSIVSNSLMGNNGLRNGAGSAATVVTSHNFFFNNTLVNASIESQLNGTENYYSQNFQADGTLSTSGAETFFNSVDVSGKLQIRESGNRLAVVVRDASTSDGAPVVTAHDHPLGNGSNDDEWQFIPTSRRKYASLSSNRVVKTLRLSLAMMSAVGIRYSIPESRLQFDTFLYRRRTQFIATNHIKLGSRPIGGVMRRVAARAIFLVLMLVAVLVALQSRAFGYTDPGTGLLAVQYLFSLAAGAVIYFRRSLLKFLRFSRSAPPEQK